MSAQRKRVCRGRIRGSVHVSATEPLVLGIETSCDETGIGIVRGRTALGTINHTLLSLEALKRRNIPVLGVAFIGDEMPDTERTIVEMGGVKRLGRLPRLSHLSPDSLSAAFAQNFSLKDFQ